MKKIAVAAGGDSGEFSISIQSGEVVYQHLDRTKYEPWFVVIDGLNWYVKAADEAVYPIDRNDFSFLYQGEKICFDLVFIAIHGNPGENGRLQGYLDMLHIPYTSCNQLVSALTFDKSLCKKLVAGSGARLAPEVLITEGTAWNADTIISRLGLPLFVKPNNNGSSVGISKVKTRDELPEAIANALKADHEVLVEAFIPGREITCGVMNDNGTTFAFPVTEIVPKKEYFDFEAKYDPLLSDEIVPAPIPADIFSQCQEISCRLYDHLKCKGVVRFDYIFRDKLIFFLEVNTVPGLTNASIVPKMAKAHGWSIAHLFGRMVENAFRDAATGSRI
ncbi:MAG TPA: D-alanine--D-alanine ligase [Bacteroidales bacterium]|nr:D-alanine--D-alanine ligase [Bacteroidales bacterium]HSA44581.1 D-alanine--D-alanine ligase [Bacteroidales bacterium]